MLYGEKKRFPSFPANLPYRSQANALLPSATDPRSLSFDVPAPAAAGKIAAGRRMTARRAGRERFLFIGFVASCRFR